MKKAPHTKPDKLSGGQHSRPYKLRPKVTTQNGLVIGTKMGSICLCASKTKKRYMQVLWQRK